MPQTLPARRPPPRPSRPSCAGRTGRWRPDGGHTAQQRRHDRRLGPVTPMRRPRYPLARLGIASAERKVPARNRKCRHSSPGPVVAARSSAAEAGVRSRCRADLFAQRRVCGACQSQQRRAGSRRAARRSFRLAQCQRLSVNAAALLSSVRCGESDPRPASATVWPVGKHGASR